MSWNKYRDQLSALLEKIDHTQEKDLYFILWLKVYRICMESIRQFELPQNQKQILISLIEKYKLKVQPALVQFFKEQKKTPMNLLLKQFKEKLFHQFEVAEESLKFLPLKSLEVLENTLFMVDLFQFTLNKSIIIISKEMVRNKISLLKNDFEVEGGSRDIEKQQKQLTQSYLNKIQGTSFPDPVAMPEIKETEMNELNSDIVLGSLSFPEENLPTSPIEPVSPSIPEVELPSEPTTPSSQILLSYTSWYPANNWTQFVNMRYNSATGRLMKNV